MKKAVSIPNALVIDLDDKLERDTLRWLLQLGEKEIAGPGNQGAYGQILVWKHQHGSA